MFKCVFGTKEPKLACIKPIFLLLFFSAIIVGCATVPIFQVPRPWTRTLKSNQPINAAGQFEIEVSGSTAPLLGSEQLIADKFRERLSYLLKRRGYSITNTKADYIVRLLYKTERNDKFRLSSTFSSVSGQFNTFATGSGIHGTSSPGVNIAQAVSALAYSATTISKTMGKETVEQVPSYTHTISLEIHDINGQLAWKGESTWDSNELDLINYIMPALQLLLSDLPSIHETRPEIPEIKADHVCNYFQYECGNKWFACPTLPYPITFKSGTVWQKVYSVTPWPTSWSTTTDTYSIRSGSIQDPYALAAYIDLITTAENALPDGDESDWENPLNISLWKKVTLGGQYLLGPSRKPVNILIKLSGNTDGYEVESCKVASDEEFGEFSAQLSRWEKALRNYYDVWLK